MEINVSALAGATGARFATAGIEVDFFFAACLASKYFFNRRVHSDNRLAAGSGYDFHLIEHFSCVYSGFKQSFNPFSVSAR